MGVYYSLCTVYLLTLNIDRARIHGFVTEHPIVTVIWLAQAIFAWHVDMISNNISANKRKVLTKEVYFTKLSKVYVPSQTCCISDATTTRSSGVISLDKTEAIHICIIQQENFLK